MDQNQRMLQEQQGLRGVDLKQLAGGVYPGPASYSSGNTIQRANMEQSAIDKKIAGLKAKMDSLFDPNEIDIYNDIIRTPASKQTPQQLALRKLNPELDRKSAMYDKLFNEISILENEKINLGKAQEFIMEGIRGANAGINKGFDNTIQGMQRSADNQMAAIQGQAGNLGASIGETARARAQIQSQVAPQLLQAEGQRAQSLANISLQQSQVPGQIQAISSQQTQDDYNRTMADIQYRQFLNTLQSQQKNNTKRPAINSIRTPQRVPIVL